MRKHHVFMNNTCVYSCLLNSIFILMYISGNSKTLSIFFHLVSINQKFSLLFMTRQVFQVKMRLGNNLVQKRNHSEYILGKKRYIGQPAFHRLIINNVAH